jgi:hypothetical protein
MDSALMKKNSEIVEDNGTRHLKGLLIFDGHAQKI